MSFRRQAPQWVTDPVSIATMLSEPTIPIIRDDFLVKVLDNGVTVDVNCRLYWTPSSAEDMVHPGVAPLAPARPQPPLAPPALEESEWRSATRLHENFSWFDALVIYQRDLKEWTEILMPTYRAASIAHATKLAAYEASVPNTTIDSPPSRLQARKPDMILTHGRGSNLDLPPIIGFNLGFARTRDSLSFAAGRDTEAHRASTFTSIAQKFPASTMCGRSMGARAAALATAGDSSGVDKLICFTYPLVRELDRTLENELLALDESKIVLFVLGNDDARAPEILLHDVRKRMRAKSWWIRVELGDHGLIFAPESKTLALAKVMGQKAAEWCVDANRDLERTEMVIGWEGPAMGGRPRWSEWEAIQNPPAT